MGVPRPRPTVEVDGVLDDVALGLQVRGDVHRGIGDEQRLGICRHVHDEDVADAPLGPEPGLPLRDLAEQLVGMEAALHQELGLALADQRDRLGPRQPGCAAHRRSRSR